MAFKRSAVRSRLSPPKQKPRFRKETGFFVVCCRPYRWNLSQRTDPRQSLPFPPGWGRLRPAAGPAGPGTEKGHPIPFTKQGPLGSNLLRRRPDAPGPGLFARLVTGCTVRCTCGSGSPHSTGGRRGRRRGFPPASRSPSGCRSATAAGSAPDAGGQGHRLHT